MRAQVATRGEGLQIVENDRRKLRVTDCVGRPFLDRFQPEPNVRAIDFQ